MALKNIRSSRIGAKLAGILAGRRRDINFIEGAGIDITVGDDPANDELDVTITNLGGQTPAAHGASHNSGGSDPIADAAYKNTANTFTQKQTFSGEIEVDGALNHDGTTVGFYNVTPVTRPTAYTQTYATTTRTHAQTAASTAHNFSALFTDTEVEAACNALGTRINELKDLLNQVIDDLQSNGMLQ